MRTCGALALRSPSSGTSLAHGRRRPQSTPTQSRPVGALSPRACARSLTIGRWYSISITIFRLPRMVAIGRSW
eukprot:1198486-Pleurochrysis_carterae.AAC.1